MAWNGSILPRNESFSTMTCDEYYQLRIQEQLTALSPRVVIFCVAVASALVSIAATLMNSLVLVVIWSNTALQTNSVILLGSLSLSDLIVALFLAPCDVYRRVMLVTGKFSCSLEDIYVVPQMYFIGVSLLTVVVITLDRFVSLFLPYWYKAR